MFHPIDFAAWDRAEYYQHYMNNARCTYSITANVDITVLYHAAKARSLRLTPCLTWLSARAVNSIVNLRFDRNSEGQVGWYDTTSPAYTVWNPETKLFSSLYTPYSESFREFYEARRAAGMVVEKANSIYAKGGYTDAQAQRNILSNPFKRFEDMQMLHHTKTLGVIQVDESVWKKLTSEEKQEIEQICNEKLEQYYRRLEKHSLRE